MASVSRHRSRVIVFQMLYARALSGQERDDARFLSAFFDAEQTFELDRDYIDDIYSGVLSRESALLWAVAKLAPRFDVRSMSRVNLIIACIALHEMLYRDANDIPDSVSIDQAVELAKRFSDESSAGFLNGLLHSATLQKDTLRESAAHDVSLTFLFHDSESESSSMESRGI